MKYKIIRTSTVPESLYQHLSGQLAFLSNYFEVIGISSPGKFLDEVKDREHIQIIPVQIKRKISLLNDIISLYKLFVIFKKQKPILVHSITPKAGLLSMLAAKMARVPLRIHTFTGLIFPSKRGFIQKLLIQMDRLLCWSATHIYPEGDGVKNDLIKFKITQKPLKLIANGNVNGVDLSFFDPKLFDEDFKTQLRKSLNISTNDFVFIFVGRLVKDKGINELVKAFRQLNCDPVKLLLVGTYEADLDPLKKSTLDEIENNSHIISVGYQEDVRPYFAIGDALVFPSYREGFPNVVLQAGAMELPSIVTDISGSNEIISDGENGKIIPPKEIDALKEKMIFFVQNKEVMDKMGLNARQVIKDKFERTIVWNSLLKEYNNLIEKVINV